MHELAVCQALIEQVERVARDNAARRILSITVSVGPLSGVEPSLLEHAYPLAAAGALLVGRDTFERVGFFDEKYRAGLQDIQAGQRIVVLFYFHRSTLFTPELLTQTPPHRVERRGVFSTCSPIRPNPIGLSVLDVLGVDGCQIHVKHVDLLDGTPILDIKPYKAEPSQEVPICEAVLKKPKG
jgi:tRNA-Thr(GGU) m(6)t(6)A37 methyltransferase TsaA